MTTNFVYFEQTEGGMEVYHFHDEYGIPPLYCWYDISCSENDKALIDFIRTARVGEMHDHRLGYCVRLEDT